MTDKLNFKTDMSFTYGVARTLLPGVDRIVANNPGPMTFHGTNTYLVGHDKLMLIDPGPEDDAHIGAVLEAAKGRKIEKILLTHRHRDHAAGLQRLQIKTGAEVHAFAVARPFLDDPDIQDRAQGFILDQVPVTHLVTNGDIISSDGIELEAVYTPGHAPDHLCFALTSQKVLFSGDHVMGWSTSVIAPPEGNMASYIESLEGLLDREDEIFLPGHGGQIESPSQTIRAFLLHRQWREQTILDAIRAGHESISSLASVIYSGVPQSVSGAAALSVLAHVELLHARGLVLCEPKPGLDAQILPA